LLKSYKTEINPTPEQRLKINRTIGVCRFVYNFYLAHNRELYESGKKFMTGKDFSKWLNNSYLPDNSDKSWIKEVSSKSVKRSLEDGYAAFRKFFDHKAGYPRFKKKDVSDPKMYFVRNNPGDCFCERHRIKIPTLGWVRLKEKGYIPTAKDGYSIKSGTVSKQAGRYYVSVLIDIPSPERDKNNYADQGIGIDLGVKELAVCSNGTVYRNINKTAKVRQLEKQLHRAQRSLSRMYENLKKGGATQRKNISKQKLKVQRIYKRMNDIRTDYMNKTISETVKTKPPYVTLEDLNVRGMMKNRHLSKAVAGQKFHEFRTRLTAKCHQNGIEVRIADMFYPSSKRCHCCGKVNRGLKLSDRIFRCECGYVADRDFNASLNLRDAEAYSLA
jgi:putative transposase